MNKLIIGYELETSGRTETGTVRILAADKIRFEVHARRNGWPVSDGPRSISFMVYAALARTGQIPADLDFEEFVETTLVDFETNPDSEGDAENPTQ